MTESPATGRAALTALLGRLGLAPATVEHPPVHTVEEALPHWERLPALHTKNLFLKDGAGGFWLISLPAARRADLKSFAKQLGAKRFSFASPEQLAELLGVAPGSVSPLALVNDAEGRVRLALDRTLVEADAVGFHPLENTATMAFTRAEFAAFLQALGRVPALLEPAAEA